MTCADVAINAASDNHDGGNPSSSQREFKHRKLVTTKSCGASKFNAGRLTCCRSLIGGSKVMSFRTGVADSTELAMLTRVLVAIAAEIGVDECSPKYVPLASHLLVLFEACKDEHRLLALMRRSAGKLGKQPVQRRKPTIHQPER
jgi:hypothetical protein